MTKVLLIEDERLAAERLERLMVSLRPDWMFLGTIETVQHAVVWLNTNPAPDLILLDIQLSDGISFEIFDQLEVSSPVIFTTAYDEYAIRAFKVNSIDYLLKPVDPDALDMALRKFDRLDSTFLFNQTKIDALRMQVPRTVKNRFLVKAGLHLMSVPVGDIELFYISNRSVFMRTFQGKTFDVDYSLDQLQHLVDPDRFFRINRNFMVNIDAIAKLVAYSSNRIKLELQPEYKSDDLIVSRDKVSEFKKWLDR